MTVTDVGNIITSNEGLKLEVYLDSRGIKTKGWGHRCDPDEVTGTKITRAEAEDLFDADLKAALNAAVGALSRSGAKKYAADLQDAWTRNNIDSRQAALLDIAFNLGEAGMLSFQGMLGAIYALHWVDAALDLLLSEPENVDRLTVLIDPESVMTPYAKQVGWRAKYNAYRLAHNSEPPKHL